MRSEDRYEDTEGIALVGLYFVGCLLALWITRDWLAFFWMLLPGLLVYWIITGGLSKKR